MEWNGMPGGVNALHKITIWILDAFTVSFSKELVVSRRWSTAHLDGHRFSSIDFQTATKVNDEKCEIAMPLKLSEPVTAGDLLIEHEGL